jgi:hypothetical protein
VRHAEGGASSPPGPCRAAGAILLLAIPAAAAAGGPPAELRPTIDIPRLSRPPTLEAFLGMAPVGDVERSMARVSGMIQQIPVDGAAASQRTEIYLGYDDRDLHVVFVAFDDEARKIRANLTRRESFFGDDLIEIMIDTFNDRRRAYAFVANPLGIQWDAIWREGQEFDDSFDTLWHSEGAITAGGYVVRMAIPFRSLRFPAAAAQEWGVIFVRDIPRNNESAFWPAVSSRIEGRLNQAGLLRGLERVSPGKNRQYIPYASGSSSKVLIDEEGVEPDYARDDDIDAGLDAKFIFRDALVLDLTANPDFSEVESDLPQVTVNQRFEVFFPERRPFFLENADFFRTPINLLFTRRIVEPRIGTRLTGKSGPFSIGALVIDDRSPQELADDPALVAGERAWFGIARASLDLMDQSNLGLMVTDRELNDGFNRVAGVDGRFKLSTNWIAEGSAVASRTREQDGTELSGPAFDLQLNRSGRNFDMHNHYLDVGKGFRTDVGFVPRTDIRDLHTLSEYRFWPERRLVNWGPDLFLGYIEDQAGTRLDQRIAPAVEFELQRQTGFGLFYEDRLERLRPEDFVPDDGCATLPAAVDFSPSEAGVWFSTQFIDPFNTELRIARGTVVNFVPACAALPEEEDVLRADVRVTLKPTGRLRNDNTYLLTRMTDREAGGRVFTNEIIRSQWYYQFTRRLTLRLILQYDDTTADEARTSLETMQNLNADLLLTYLVNPWTALYVGANGNYQDLALIEDPGGNTLVRTDDGYLNDARLFFVKFSYLIRP